MPGRLATGDRLERAIGRGGAGARCRRRDLVPLHPCHRLPGLRAFAARRGFSSRKHPRAAFDQHHPHQGTFPGAFHGAKAAPDGRFQVYIQAVRHILEGLIAHAEGHNVAHIPGNALAGGWRSVLIIDDQATDHQHNALVSAF
ncbi:DUF1326 domain-containing protein [Ectothiorhodospira marina]|uniref:DUF1326 domain-containing protein n=1 Tax=Ectothiorhodospira marina TaxID=1396821 RepID=UPI003CCBDD9D